VNRWEILHKMERQNRLVEYMLPKEKFNWGDYNRSQANEKLLFMRLLHELCKTVDMEFERKTKRHRAGSAHKIYSMCLKVYSRLGARRLPSELEISRRFGYVNTVSHFNTILNYFDDKDLTIQLKYLIELSSLPLAQLEAKGSFAIDATGISLRQYEPRWSHVRSQYEKHQKYKKLHIICACKSNIIVSCLVTKGTDADAPRFGELLKNAAKSFDIAEITADKAYLSRKNLTISKDLGIDPYIPFKSNSTVGSRGCESWSKAYRFFRDHLEEFEKHYHVRSNVETCMYMIKNKFGDFCFFKKEVSQENEILCKILCHNIGVLIQEIFLNKIEVDFLDLARQSAHE